MISPKLLFQCSSASLLASAVLAAPVFLSHTPKNAETCVTKTDTNVRKHHSRPLKTQARFERPPPQMRSHAARNRAANQAMRELSDALEDEAESKSQSNLKWQFRPNHHSNRWVITVEGEKDQRRAINLNRLMRERR